MNEEEEEEEEEEVVRRHSTMFFVSLFVFVVLKGWFVHSLVWREISADPISEVHRSKGVSVHNTEIILRCLARDSFVRLSDGKTKSISSLDFSDRLIGEDRSTVVSTSLLFILDEQVDLLGSFSSLVDRRPSADLFFL